MRFPKTQKGKDILKRLIQDEISIYQLADALDISYSYLSSVIYGRYEKENVMSRVEEYLGGLNEERRNGENVKGEVGPGPRRGGKGVSEHETNQSGGTEGGEA